jgi:tRNA threonylcarbamoyladenosine modification (KEOPS) complex Cgi121 subunit
MTLVNTKYVASITHLNIGIARALINKNNGTSKTQNLGNEVLYHLYPTHSIKESFEKFGLKNSE